MEVHFQMMFLTNSIKIKETMNTGKKSNLAEKTYILKRRMKAFGNQICFHLCRVFSIEEKLISVCTFEGKGGFGCNAKPIVEELHRIDPGYRFVWFVNDMDKVFPRYIQKVPNTLWSRAYWLSRSKVWIDNYRKPYGTCKRKGQYYLNVNHYTVGIKCTGLWRGEGFSQMAYLVSKNDSDMIDDLVIDSDWCEHTFPKALVYEGTYLKVGAPRCDVLYGDRSRFREQFRKKHGLAEETKVVMFAPTFREGARNGKRSVYSGVWTIDFGRLLVNLEEKFGGCWYLCVRVHPQLAPGFHEYKDEALKDKLIDESQADDMYEILAGMDAYITDYSSACFEACFAEIPVFLYADDIEKYTSDRGALMWDMVAAGKDGISNNKEITSEFDLKLPFTLSRNNEELENEINVFNETIYQQKVRDFCDAIGLIFDGRASKRIVEVIRRRKGNRY